MSNETVEFEVNGYKCGYDGVLIWRVNEDGLEEDVGSFEDITLLEITSHCAIFYSECLNEYLAFYGEEFRGISNISFKIVPSHEMDIPHLSIMWEQVRVIIDDDDIINRIGSDDDFHWGIESSCFLVQKDEYHKGKLHIGISASTCQGDDDILVDIDYSENYISWKIYHDRNHEKNEIFAFNKKDYNAALADAKRNITQKEEDAYDWSWLLSYSKNELTRKYFKKGGK